MRKAKKEKMVFCQSCLKEVPKGCTIQFTDNNQVKSCCRGHLDFDGYIKDGVLRIRLTGHKQTTWKQDAIMDKLQCSWDPASCRIPYVPSYESSKETEWDPLKSGSYHKRNALFPVLAGMILSNPYEWHK